MTLSNHKMNICEYLDSSWKKEMLKIPAWEIFCSEPCFAFLQLQKNCLLSLCSDRILQDVPFNRLVLLPKLQRSRESISGCWMSYVSLLSSLQTAYSSLEYNKFLSELGNQLLNNCNSLILAAYMHCYEIHVSVC